MNVTIIFLTIFYHRTIRIDYGKAVKKTLDDKIKGTLQLYMKNCI